MNLFASISLIVSISCALLAIFTLLHARNQTHRIWWIFNINVAIWCLGLYFIGISQSPSEAFYYWKLTLVFNTFISVFLYHVVYSFCQMQVKRFLVFAYLQGIFFAFIIMFYKPFITDLNFIFNSIYYPNPTPLFSLWLFIFSFITLFSFYKIWRFVKITHGVKKIEGLYLFWSMLVGFGGGYTIALPAYNILVYPVWHSCICIYTAIFTFAILRHSFLDIRIALVRFLLPLSVFAAVSFILCFIYFDMNFFAAASLSLAILCSLLAYMIFAYARERMHYLWALFNIAVAMWGYLAFFIGRCTDPQLAVMLWRIAFIGVLFISVFFYHVICLFCQIKRPKTILFAYIQSCFFLLLNATNLYISEVFLLRGSFYYLKAKGIFFPISFAIWFILVVAALIELIIYYRRCENRLRRAQTLYLFIGFALGFVGGTTNFLPMFGLPILPLGNITIPLYCIIATYAILRYQLLDIRIAVTRMGVFVAVYSFVLGIPFGLTILGKQWLTSYLGENWFLVPMISLLVLATVGPFIYLFLQRKAENRLLQEERRMQDLLHRASVGMRTIRNLHKLLELIVDVLAKSLGLDNAVIYLHDPVSNQFVLNVSMRDQAANVKIEKNDPLIVSLEETKYLIVYEELKLLSESQKAGEDLCEIVRQMTELEASVIVPAIAEDILLGFIILGERKDKRIYTADLINVLSVLGNQAGLAIENAMFYVEREKLLNERFERRRFESLGTLTNSISHQMSNRFHAIMQRVGVVWDVYSDEKYKGYSREELIGLAEASRKSIERVLAIAEDGGKVTDAIQNYSKGKIEVGVVNFDAAVDRSIEFVQLKHAKFKFEVKKEYPKGILLWGVQALIQDIIANAVDNSCYAMQMKKKNDESFNPRIIIRGEPNKTMFNFEIEDNGIGIRKDDLKKVTDPMYSTRSHLDGTGMGTTVILQFVQKHGGTIIYDSEWGEWTKVKISLPLAREEQKGAKKANGY